MLLHQDLGRHRPLAPGYDYRDPSASAAAKVTILLLILSATQEEVTAFFFAKKADHGSPSKRLELYERNSNIQTSFNSRNAEGRIGVTPGVIYSLGGECAAVGTARSASGNV
jgi:hypothetical protein